MKNLTKSRLAFVVAAAMGIAGCGSDGKDGEDGAPGEPGPGPTPPVTEMSEVTHITMISHAIEEGQIRYEFEVTNEEDELVEGLVKAEAKFAEKTERGVVLNRDGAIGGYTDTTKEGTVLTGLGEGRYELVAAMPAVTVASEGIVWLRVGGDDSTQIARSQPLVVDKPEMIHTSTTETCYSCHVDYATSSQRHASYTAINVEGDVDFVAGCLVCHNNVSRAEEDGGYATNTLQKIGHINHQKFEKDFTPTNCYTCHAEPVMNTSIAGNGCSDCHSTDMSDNMALLSANSDFDAREFHTKSDKIGIDERQTIREGYFTTLSEPYYEEVDFTIYDRYGEIESEETEGFCTDLELFTTDETPVKQIIKDLYDDGKLVYTSAYLHGYYNESLVGRPASSYGKVDREDGTRSLCFAVIDSDAGANNLMASSRLTFADSTWSDDDGKNGVSFTSYSTNVTWSGTELGTEEFDYDRRHAVTTESCTTCHNDETNYHKNGSYAEGGLDCVACHNNGQDRSAKNSAPGFGPMVHSMHWGIGNTLSGAKTDEETGENVVNSAASLNADNCVSCHAEGISLAEIPNQYMLSKAFNGGTSGVMTSPVTANCYACHDSASALSHMEQNGGELNVEAADGTWYTEGTSESCATCHDTGKSFGIDKFHNFER
ncbi:hypothetical protein Q4601_13425 [Shewanella sp. 1_MG-2023]|uniref:multiheme c-type cytochrome n=1 Tax=unclassified Shewanella TaxID=196818 RepID=UPI0026E1E974|nr:MULTISPECIES: hypothetical protein [unclassified Shewanella]MDO6612627.1 hypothetical protein [Shewanella sp. 7_MG-2023]MDO6772326.1 hypothetical protein [Shewanella sp. 2_MG-2023]MDO6795309.1 hypothetical protein [Shewanella sp. 1_MG-2023]